MMNTKYILLISVLLSAMSLSLFSCGKDIEETDSSVQKRILEAYINKYYPDATLLESGIYLLDSIPGTGRYPKDSSYVLVSYSIKYLDNTYADYTYDSLAKQLGEYSHSGYYHPVVWYMEDISSGIAECVKRMREGGSLSAIIPAWYFDKSNSSYSGEGSSKVYEIKLHEVINDLDQYEYNVMRSFSNKHFYIRDTTEYGFFFDIPITSSYETLPDTTTVQIKYIGRYMDYKIFDTNIADTAKKYRIFSGNEDDYKTLSFKHYSQESMAISENSFVHGFSKAANRLKKGEKAVTFFYHELGYGAKGSGDIPGYIPLCFEIWVETDDK